VSKPIPSDFDSAFREMLRVIVKEVAAETRANDSRDAWTIESKASNQTLLLNSREAAQALSISEPHLSRLTRSGVIPPVRVGKCRRYRSISLQLFHETVRGRHNTQTFLLGNEMLIIMAGRRQHPKSKLPVGNGINLTFRQIVNTA
jgi:excisionase family DNA binding protein